MNKANVINISLNDLSKTIKPNSLYNNSNIKKTILGQKTLNDCCEIIKSLKDQNQKKKHERHNFTISTQSKQKKQIEDRPILISSQYTESMELVLKQYINFKIEQKQKQISSQGFPSSNSKSKLGKKFIIKKHDNKNQQNAFIEDYNEHIFNEITNNKNKQANYLSKIHQLQIQITFYKQKLREKEKRICTLESKQKKTKKKYEFQIQKIIRHYNLININNNLFYNGKQKNQNNFLEVLGNNQEKNMNISGNLGPNKLQKWKHHKQDTIVDKYSNGSKLNKTKFNQQQDKNLTESSCEDNRQKTEQYQRQVTKIKIELEGLQKKKAQMIKDLKNNSEISQIEKMILIKTNEITDLEQLINKNKSSISKEYFESLQLNGYYNQNEDLEGSNFGFEQ